MKELLDKFTNGVERYENDPVFHQSMEMLYRGADPLKVLDTVLKMRQQTQELLVDYVRRSPMPLITYIPNDNSLHLDLPYTCLHSGCNNETLYPFVDGWKMKDHNAMNSPINILKLLFLCPNH